MNRHLTIPLILLLTLFLMTTSAFAQNRMGFRLNLGGVPGVDEIEITDSLGPNLIYLDDQRGININPTFVFRSNVNKPIGFVGAAGIFIRTHEGEDIVGDEARLTAFGISLSPGFAVRLGKSAHLEFRGELGLGSAVHDVDGYEDEGSGPYTSVGVIVGAYFQVSHRMALGFDVGYLDFESEGEVGDFFTTADTEMKGSGTTSNISMSFMF